MGKVFSTLQRLKSKNIDDRRTQEKVFKSLADDDSFEWQNPDHRSTMVEATHAAQRLSIYNREPEDSEKRKQYIKDQQTVEDAIETIKQNKTGNMTNIKVAVTRAIQSSPNDNDTLNITPAGTGDDIKSEKWTFDSSHETHLSEQKWNGNSQSNAIKPSTSTSSPPHSSAGAHIQFEHQFAPMSYDTEHEPKASEVWDSDSVEAHHNETHNNTAYRKKSSISSSYPYDEKPHHVKQRKSISSSYPYDDPPHTHGHETEHKCNDISTSDDVIIEKHSEKQTQKRNNIVITVTDTKTNVEYQWDDDGRDDNDAYDHGTKGNKVITDEIKQEMVIDDDDDGYTQERSSSDDNKLEYEHIILDKRLGISEVRISVPKSEWNTDNESDTDNDHDNLKMPQVHKQQSLAAPTSYSGMRIQVDVLCSFHDEPWILNKDKHNDMKHLKIKHSDRIKNVNEYHRKRKVSLTNAHNFLWFTTTIQSGTYGAEKESELTRKSLDKVLNLLPIPFRDKIWEICNPDNDTFMFQEDYAEFADAMLIATGQYDITDDVDEIDFEIRDMTDVFVKIVNINKIFSSRRYCSKWSKSARCLSTEGATMVVLKARNLKSRAQLNAKDGMSIALLTGFTKKALKHAIEWCTRVFWKLLTDCFWDEDDEEDMALPVSLSKYGNGNQSHKKLKLGSRRGTKINPNTREAMKIAMSMEVLFPDLLFDESDAEEFDQTFTQYLQIIE